MLLAKKRVPHLPNPADCNFKFWGRREFKSFKTKDWTSPKMLELQASEPCQPRWHATRGLNFRSCKWSRRPPHKLNFAYQRWFILQSCPTSRYVSEWLEFLDHPLIPRGVHSLLYFAYTCIQDLFIGGVIYLAEKIIRWWYFTCKKPANIIGDGILHVNMFHYFQIPYFICNFFTKFTYNEYIGPYFLSHVVLRFSPNDLPGLEMMKIWHSFPRK